MTLLLPGASMQLNLETHLRLNQGITRKIFFCCVSYEGPQLKKLNTIHLAMLDPLNGPAFSVSLH